MSHIPPAIIDMLEESLAAGYMGDASPWTLTVVNYFRPDDYTSGQLIAARWVWQCLERLLPFTADDWIREELEEELRWLLDYQKKPADQAELEAKLEQLHQRFHQDGQPAVNNLAVALWCIHFKENKNGIGSLRASLHFMLEATGNLPEHRKIVLDELHRVARTECPRIAGET